MHLFEEVSGGPGTEGAVRRRPQIALGRAGYGSLVLCLLDASSGDLPGVGCAGWGGLDVPFAVFDLAVVDVAEADEILDVRRAAEGGRLFPLGAAGPRPRRSAPCGRRYLS